MSHSTFLGAALVAVVGLTSGCAAVGGAISDVQSMMETSKAASRHERVQNFADPHAISAFYVGGSETEQGNLPQSLLNAGFKIDNIGQSVITLEKTMWDRGNMGQIADLMADYRYDSERDAVSAEFVSMATQRGSEVRVYRPALTGRVNSLFGQPFKPLDKTREWYAADVLLVEYDDMNRPLSMLIRSHQAVTLMGVSSFQFPRIMTGASNMRHFENNISANELENAYLRTYR